MIKSKDIAALYTAEQREEICRCCRKNNHNNCKDCAIPVTAAHKGEKNVKFNTYIVDNRNDSRRDSATI